MVKASFLAAISATLLATAAAAPAAHCSPAPPHSGPKINVIFFSDDKCTTTVPHSGFTRNVFASACVNNPKQTYNSLIIDHIDDQFIGTNSALQVGNTAGVPCDFTHSEKFSIATRDNVGKCQFIGISQGAPGKPLLGGNEYQLAPLQG